MNNNLTILRLLPDNSFVYVEESDEDEVALKYFVFGVEFKILETHFDKGDLQRKAQGTIERSINEKSFGDGSEDRIGIKDFSVIGSEKMTVSKAESIDYTNVDSTRIMLPFVIAGVIVLSMSLLFLLYCVRRRKNLNRNTDNPVTIINW